LGKGQDVELTSGYDGSRGRERFIDPSILAPRSRLLSRARRDAGRFSLSRHVVIALDGSSEVTQEKSISRPPNTTTPTRARKHTATTTSSTLAGREPASTEP